MVLLKSIRKCYFFGKNSDVSVVLRVELFSFEENIDL